MGGWIFLLSTINSQLKTTYSFSCSVGPIRSEAVRDATWGARFCGYPEIPRRKRPQNFRHPAAPRLLLSDVLHENVHRMIRRVRAHRCTSIPRTQENRRPG